MALSKEQIEEGNPLIAEFMGAFKSPLIGYKNRYEITGNSFPDFMWTCTVEKMKYHTSFDWLMPVCKKIKSVPFDYNFEFELSLEDLNYAAATFEIERLYLALINCIKLYNNKTNNQC